MADRIDTDICVIGGGSGGLSVAAGASQMGASTVLIERGKMGGDCLNYGCVPSKSLLAAGHHAAAAREAPEFGVDMDDPKVAFPRVNAHVLSVIGAIAPHDSVERFEGLGVNVIQGTAAFSGPRSVVVGDTEVHARRIVVATGSRAFVPPIPGIDETPHFTNETIFDNTVLPAHLIIVGGGPIGLEMAQAHRQLGARVTVLELFSIMPKDDPELVAVVRRRLDADGIEIREGVKIARVARDGEGVAVVLEGDDGETRVAGSHLLIAAGRRPNVQGMDLEKAGIAYSDKGIQVDARLRTSNKKVFAIGDVAGGLQFTHVAGYHAGIVIRNALFRLPAKADHSAVPWVTFTDPELAQVGMGEAAAREAHGDDLRILRWSFDENDRAQAERRIEGQVKVVTTTGGRILGAGIVGKNAGELIHPWVLAMSAKLKIGAMASYIAPYPTLGEVGNRAAGSFFTPKLFSDHTRAIVRFLARFG
jgi:pyruvate/2-oxoglutarate dehydrogenase complex dihydrolipoamide dehydrogenase (E3) component